MGFRVHTTLPAKFQTNDLFNLWDHVAVSPEHTLWVQTKSREIYGKELEGHVDFPSDKKFLFVWVEEEPNTLTLIIKRI